MDIADRAQEIEEIFREMALKTCRDSFLKSWPTGPHIDITIDGERRCKKCGESIPVERLRAVPGTKLCVRCQTEYETGRPAPESRREF